MMVRPSGRALSGCVDMVVALSVNRFCVIQLCRTNLLLPIYTHLARQSCKANGELHHLLTNGASRLLNRHGLVLLTNSEASYATLFPEIFGHSYRPSRNGTKGRLPNVRFRISRTLARVQTIKHRQGKRVVYIEIHYTHGSQKRVSQVLGKLGYTTPTPRLLSDATAQLDG